MVVDINRARHIDASRLRRGQKFFVLGKLEKRGHGGLPARGGLRRAPFAHQRALGGAENRGVRGLGTRGRAQEGLVGLQLEGRRARQRGRGGDAGRRERSGAVRARRPGEREGWLEGGHGEVSGGGGEGGEGGGGGDEGEGVSWKEGGAGGKGGCGI